MSLKLAAAVVALVGFVSAAVPVRATCSLDETGHLPVTMVGTAPTIPATINGVDVKLTADTGASISLITPQAAAKANLKVGPPPVGIAGLYGVGGREEVRVARADTFTIIGITVRNTYFLVGAPQINGPSDGLVANNFLSFADAEFDLANGVIRFFKPSGCGADASLAYWAKPGTFTAIPIEPVALRGYHIVGEVQVNGRSFQAIFDTGAARSFITRPAAMAAGVSVADAGVRSGGMVGGIGRGGAPSWIAHFKSLQIGDELISAPDLRISDVDVPGIDMLIGADFFLSHRVYVANSQNRLYFSYNGGPVFNLDAPSDASKTPAPIQTIVPAASAPGAPSDVPTDAAGFARRGAAFEARNDLGHAIADFNRAAGLDPANSEYLYDRAKAELANHQAALARTDADRALTLKADATDALMLRGQLRLDAGDDAGAKTDLDAAIKLKPDLAFPAGAIYAHSVRADAAVAAFDQWIAANPKDVRLATAYNLRCWARAVADKELERALADCDEALKRAPHAPGFLDSRGLVKLRLGRLDESIADYDEALRLQPKQAWSLYGRGLARRRLGKQAEGDADIAAAVAMAPDLPDEAKRYGLAP